MALGSDLLMVVRAAEKVSCKLHDFFAPDALYAIYQFLVRFFQVKRTAQRMDGNLAKFDLLLREAEV